MNAMAKIDLPYVQAYADRHGKRRHYYRKPGLKRIPLPGPPGSAEFLAAYAAASDTKGEGAGVQRTQPKTINALIVAYYQSAKFTKNSTVTQAAYRGQLDAFRMKTAPKSKQTYGEKSAVTIQHNHLDAIFADLAGTPAQTSNLRKRLLAIFRLAVKMGWRNDNPLRETERIEYKTKGFTPWSEDEIEQFRIFWGEGSKPVRALTILLTTGVRRSDAHTLGRQHVKDGTVKVRQAKGGAMLVIPAHADLLAVAEATPAGQMTFIVTEYGVPFTRAGFTGWFVERAKKAGLKDRTPHGLRKAVGRRLAEAGCSEMQIAAVLGHTDPNTAKIYTKSANQILLASDAMGMVGAKEERALSTR
jgi:integrase